ALAASYRHKRWKEKRRGERIVLEEDKARSIREIVLGSPSSGPQERWLPFPSICEALAELEIRSPRQVVLAPAERVTKEHLRGFSYPLVLKLLSSEIIHKTEVGGVILGIRDFQDLERALRRLKAATAALPGHVDGYLVQEEIQDGVEAFVGVAPDPTFGPLLMCGIGGTQVELLKDIAFSVVPVTDSRAEEMIGSLKAKALLEGFRGAPSLDKEALVEIILKTSALVEAVPEVSEIDFNPIKVLPRGEGAVVVDARVRFAADDSRRS
ncbi:MAG: acetate--CoA ligase family protein, partial [Deltaproteobacteria bacterium]|nr:acetate--CoA ligase family protein [Deltaproteobacteria bacterium]